MFESLRKIICQYVETEEEMISENSRFSEDLGFNSYDFLCMLGEAEEEFDVEINETEASSKKTVGELIKYFEDLK